MRKTLGAGIAGLVIAGSAAFGTGTAAAEPSYCRTTPPRLLTSVQEQACGLLGPAGGTATGAAQSVPRAVTSAVPRAVPRVVPRVVEGVGGTVGGVTRRTGSAPATRSPRPSSSSGGASGAGAATRAPAAGTAATPTAPTRNDDTLMSSAYDRVPTGLLGTSPVGGAGTSLVGPTAFDPWPRLSGRPSRTPGGPENGVTTGSTADPAAYPGGRLGTPALLGALTASSVLALFVRTVVLRPSRRPAGS